MQPLEVPTRLWEEVRVDLITQLPDSNGYNAILVCTDLFGNQIHTIPYTTNISAKDIADFTTRRYSTYMAFPLNSYQIEVPSLQQNSCALFYPASGSSQI